VLSVRCRRCPGCLRARRYLWALRAQLETFEAQRTLLFTGTYRDQPYDREVAAAEVTRYFKRLRKSLDEPLRYLCCFERHKSGAWHCHMLLHSNYPRDLTTKAARRPWLAGWSKANVANLQAAGYVTKYVTKDLADESTERIPRIRASRDPRYGAAVMCHEEAIVQMLQERRQQTTQEVWTANIKMLHNWLIEQEKGNRRVWQEIAAAQEGTTLVDLGGGVRVDPETGETTTKVLSRR